MNDQKITKREKIVAWCLLYVASMFIDKQTDSQADMWKRIQHEIYVGTGL